jgi:hypothetical protein
MIIENLPQRADYQRAIYETLLRIERLFQSERLAEPLAEGAPDPLPAPPQKLALSIDAAAETLGIGRSKMKDLIAYVGCHRSNEGTANCAFLFASIHTPQIALDNVGYWKPLPSFDSIDLSNNAVGDRHRILDLRVPIRIHHPKTTRALVELLVR